VFDGITPVAISYKQPARRYWVQITSALLDASDAPEAYRPLIEATLRASAKAIASDYIKAFSTDALPTIVPADLLTRDAIIDRATSSGMEWLTKEELTAAWMESATRKQWIVDRASDYKDNKVFRAQVNAFAEDIQKLAAKNISLPPERCEVLLAKLRDEDLSTAFGEFVVQRLTTLKDKPLPELQSADML
jgi:hypothetical protein